MSFHGLTEDERRELADAVGTIVSFFVDATHTARGERDAALARAEAAERRLARLTATRPDGAVLATHVSP